MKILLSLLILFTTIIAAGFWANHSLNTSSAELIQNINTVSGELEKNNWDAAYEKVTGLEAVWREKAKWWPTILDHQEMDNIEFAMARIKEYVAARDIALTRGQLSELKLMIQHIPEKEKVSLKNIF